MASKRGAAELEGQIREFSLLEIVQFLSGSRKTGILHMRASEGDPGAIFFAEGTIVHATVGPISGEEAFYALMQWREGHFSFEPDQLTDERTVRQGSTNLLLEGARREDEWAVLSEHIPSVDLIPEFLLPTDGETGKQITLNTSEWVVLSKIDGERSVKEVAAAASLSEFHTCRLIYPLIVNNLIRLRKP